MLDMRGGFIADKIVFHPVKETLFLGPGLKFYGTIERQINWREERGENKLETYKFDFTLMVRNEEKLKLLGNFYS